MKENEYSICVLPTMSSTSGPVDIDMNSLVNEIVL